jgi:hypothetical protein
VIVVGERGGVEPRDVAGVGEIFLGRAGAVGELRVAVQVGPIEMGSLGLDDQRVALFADAAGDLLGRHGGGGAEYPGGRGTRLDGRRPCCGGRTDHLGSSSRKADERTAGERDAGVPMLIEHAQYRHALPGRAVVGSNMAQRGDPPRCRARGSRRHRMDAVHRRRRRPTAHEIRGDVDAGQRRPPRRDV